VTVAVLFAATTEEADATEEVAIGDPIAESITRVAGQLRAAGAREVWLVDCRARPVTPAGVTALTSADVAGDLRAAARLAREAGEPLLLGTADLVANDSVLLTLATEPGGRACALVGGASGGMGHPAAREERGRITSLTWPSDAPAGAGADAGGTAFLGALRIPVAVLESTADACDRAADAWQRGVDRRTAQGANGERAVDVLPRSGVSAVDLLLAELLDSGAAVQACRIRLLYAQRVTRPDEVPDALAAAAAVDEDAARLRLAVKERDDFFTTYCVSSFSPHVTRWAARLGLSPAAVTAGSLLLAMFAAGAYAVGSRPALIAGGVLLYAAFVLDCVDGQLARYTRRFSAFGGWLDTMADRAKEYLVYAGLAAGAMHTGLRDAWPLAIAAMALQTCRHMTDFWYGALHDEAVARRVGIFRPDTAAAGLGGRLGQASERVQAGTGSLAYWLKRIVVFPIGERWALIAGTAALFNGRVALLAVLVWAGLAAAYTLALRTLRSRSMRVPVLAVDARRDGAGSAATADLARQRDDGLLSRYLLGAIGARLAGIRLGAGAAGKLAAIVAPLPLAAIAALAAAALVGADLAGVLDDHSARPWLVLTGLVVLLAGVPARAAHAGALDWLVPAALRAAEYLFVVGVAVAGGVRLPLLFLLLFLIAMHHYDVTARTPGRGRRWLLHVPLGWDGRVVLLIFGAGFGLVTGVVWALAGYLGMVLALGAVTGWTPGSIGRGASTGAALAGARDLTGVHIRQQSRKV
jgi:phosphatidylglycerophosphate synthase